MVFEHREQYASQSEAIGSIAEKIGCSAETLRKWIRRAEIDAGRRGGLTTDERVRIKDLEREVRELRRSNEILRKASADCAQATRTASRARRCGAAPVRCQFHLQQNAQAYVPNVAMRPQVVRDLRSVFHSTDRAEADERLAKLVDKYRRPAPKLAEWMETNVPEGPAVFALPEPHPESE